MSRYNSIPSIKPMSLFMLTMLRSKLLHQLGEPLGREDNTQGSSISDENRFLKIVPGDTTFQGETGETMWRHLLGYLGHLGSREKFLNFITEGLGVEDVPGVTMTPEPTTMPPLPPDMEESVVFIYDQLVPTFRNKAYRQRWMDSNKKGYDTFVKELEELGPVHFLYVPHDDTQMKGAQGALMWEAIVKLFQCLHQVGFDDFVEKVDNLPENFKREDLLMRVRPTHSTDQSRGTREIFMHITMPPTTRE